MLRPSGPLSRVQVSVSVSRRRGCSTIGSDVPMRACWDDRKRSPWYSVSVEDISVCVCSHVMHNSLTVSLEGIALNMKAFLLNLSISKQA